MIIKQFFPVVLLGFSLAGQAIATGYTYKTIDPPAGGRFLSISAMNNKGQVIGNYFGSDNHSHGFIHNNGLFTTLDVPSALGDDTWLTGINNKGQMIGGYYKGVNYPTYYYSKHGFLFSNATFTTIDRPAPAVDLDTLPFGSHIDTNLTGINDNGQILGNSVIFTRTSHPFDTSNTNAFINNAGNVLDIFVGKQPTCVDINASGQVICNSAYNFSPYLDVLFYDGVSSLDISTPYPEGITVKSLNDAGQFVGGIKTNNSANDQGFLYSHGIFKTLPNITLAGGSFIPYVSSINASGQIVGNYNSGYLHGFVYDKGTYKPFDIPGAISTLIFANNARGQIIGRYDNSAGTHMFIATPMTAKPTTEKQCKKNGWKTFGFKNRKACIKYVESLEEDDEADDD